MGTNMFRIIMVLMWALGGMIILLGLFNSDYGIVLLGASCFVTPLILPVLVILISRIPRAAPKKSKATDRDRSRRKPSGRWAEQGELEDRKMFDANPAVLLGRWGDDKRVIGGHCRRILTFAAKPDEYYRATAIPNSLMFPGNLFIYERTGHIFRSVKDRRDRLGQKVIVVDPFGQSGIVGDSFNPLDFVRHTGEGLISDAGMIADLLLAPAFVAALDVNEARAARTLLQGVMVYTIQRSSAENRNLAEVRRNMTLPVHRFYKILEDLMSVESADSKISDIAMHILEMTEDQRSSIIEVCRQATEIFEITEISRATASTSFDVETITMQPSSIFVIGNADQDHEAPGMAAFSRIMFGAIMGLIEKRNWKKGDREYLVLFEGIEEMGRLAMLERLLGGALTDGIAMWPCFAGVSSLMDVCNNWENVVGRTDAIQVLSQDGAFDLDWVAGLTAMTKFEDTGRGSSHGDNSPAHLRAQDAEAILKSVEVARFPAEEEILFRKGVPPIRAWRLDGHRDEMFRGMALQAPTF